MVKLIRLNFLLLLPSCVHEKTFVLLRLTFFVTVVHAKVSNSSVKGEFECLTVTYCFNLPNISLQYLLIIDGVKRQLLSKVFLQDKTNYTSV